MKKFRIECLEQNDNKNNKINSWWNFMQTSKTLDSSIVHYDGDHLFYAVKCYERQTQYIIICHIKFEIVVILGYICFDLFRNCNHLNYCIVVINPFFAINSDKTLNRNAFDQLRMSLSLFWSNFQPGLDQKSTISWIVCSSECKMSVLNMIRSILFELTVWGFLRSNRQKVCWVLMMFGQLVRHELVICKHSMLVKCILMKCCILTFWRRKCPYFPEF